MLSVHSQAQGKNTIAVAIGSQPLTLKMCEFRSHVLPPGTFAAGVQPETWTWGYVAGDTCPSGVQETYLGPVIVNTRGIPTEINFVNELGFVDPDPKLGTRVDAYRYSTDQTLHWADPLAEQKDGIVNMCNMMGGIPPFDSVCSHNYYGPIAAVPHLHGGEVPPELDGGPDAWFTSDGQFKGHAFYSKAGAAANAAIYRYPNSQQAAPLWFHDHTLGATRLNVFAGLAGGYYLIDPAQQLPWGDALASVAEIVPIILQDRMFDNAGQLFFPADSAGLYSPNPEHPYWVPEFVGDTIVVNGKAWPFFEAQPKRYRFLFLNGSNARTYELFLIDTASNAAPSMYVIGNDGGYLDVPAKLDPQLGQKLLIMPGERYEVIIDFAGLAPGTTLVLKNTAKTPFPAGAAPKGNTVGRILQFRIVCPAAGCPTDTSWDPAVAPATIRLNQPIVRLTNPATGALAAGVAPDKTRQLTLNEVLLPPSVAPIDPVTGAPNAAYLGGPVEILVNNTKFSGDSTRTYGDFRKITINGVTTAFSEIPVEGTTEVWEIVNLTADAHPIHTHLASFQILNRQAFNVGQYAAQYALAFPGSPGCPASTYCPGFGPPLDYNSGNLLALGGNPAVEPFLQGPIKLPAAQEVGWKDTLMVPPGMVTRFVVRWAPNDAQPAPASQLAYPFSPAGGHGYVWHCHIIDHEDNEMMRPDVLDENPGAVPKPVRTYVKGIDY